MCGNQYENRQRFVYHLDIHFLGPNYLSLAPPFPPEAEPAPSANSTNDCCNREANLESGFLIYSQDMGNACLCLQDTFKRSTGEDLNEYYPIRPDLQDDAPKSRFKHWVGMTLSERRWKAAISEDGQIDIVGVLRRIQRGGIHPSIKAAVWEFLLGCFDPNSTNVERNELRKRRREKYAALKDECHKMVSIFGSGKFITTPIVNNEGEPVEGEAGNLNGSMPENAGVTEKEVIQWKLSLSQIGLDVVRTDRTLVFYESEANQARLWEVLAVYSWVDYKIGYVQGMNDICSPMIILLEDDADAFWCYEHAMRRLRENFRTNASSMGVQSQLDTLSEIMKVVDPKLHQHLEDLDGGEYLFAFRMLMVLFRREFSFLDSLYLWEVMWAMEYNPNMFQRYEKSEEPTAEKVNNENLKQYGKFERKNVGTGSAEDRKSALAVYLVAGFLETKNKKLLQDAKGLDDVVQIMGDMTGNVDAKKALNKALKVHKKYIKAKGNSQ
ncbi:Rab-GAP TBC domain-containing protein [Heracleum sosnowskyi]|uniref:Rab-GAP TBC domain-containing protein n=1 Tax=Heracleum sosnowskyi TaxID=360622 RepID=A0AAD8LZX5_9APIA|nr:Rab-GAP TBC domain-containing protein [Heracleum sosnowskyi]